MAELYDTGIFSVNDTDGSVGAGWKLNFYQTLTSTRQDTYPTEADADAATNANTNPVVAAADGRFPPIWLPTTGSAYKAVLTNATDVVKETLDPAVGSLSRALASTAAGKGAALVGFIQSGDDAVARTVLTKLREVEVSVTDFITAGFTPGQGRDVRETPSVEGTDLAYAFRAAADALQVLGGGRLRVPALDGADEFYSIQSPIIMWPGITLIGDGPNVSVVRNVNTAGSAWKNSILLAGNLHPGHLEAANATHYALDAFTQGASSFTLTTAGDATNFSVGDQLAVVSTVMGTTSGFDLPLYMILCTVTGKVGAVITVDESLDIPTDATAVILNDTPWRAEAWFAEDYLFFASGGVKDIGLIAGDSWSIDSAVNRFVVDNVDFQGRYGPVYGNAYQNYEVRRTRASWHKLAGELSMNSYRVKVRDSLFYYLDGTWVDTPVAQFAIGECARYIDIDRSNVFDFGAAGAASNEALVRISASAHAGLFPRINAPGSRGTSPLIQVSATATQVTSDFPMHDINAGLVGAGGSCGRWVYVDGDSNADFYDIHIRDHVATGTFSATGTECQWDDLAGEDYFIEDSILAAGKIQRAATGPAITIRNSFIFNAYNVFDRALIDDTAGMSDQYSQTKRIAQFRPAATLTAPENVATTIFNRAIGRLRPGDRIDVEAYAVVTGTGGDKTFELCLWNDTDDLKIAIPSSAGIKAQIAATTTDTHLKASIQCYTSTPTCTYDVSYDDAAPSRAAGFQPTASKDLSVRLLCTIAAVGTSVAFSRANVQISSPVFDYLG